MSKITRILSMIGMSLSALPSQAAVEATPTLSYQQSAEIIRHTYDSQLVTLSNYAQSHYGLRMLRQSQDSQRYSAMVWNDLTRIANTLNTFAASIHTPEQIVLYAQSQLAAYRERPDERSQRRYNATKNMPEYLYLGGDLLSALARVDEYGLQHQQAKALHQIFKRYDFEKYVTSKPMIEAWAPQLANQVLWLRQLDEQDVVRSFTKAFRATYPDNQDASLTASQYENKLAGMTHLVFADSHYFQRSVDAKRYAWIYDYFRRHIDTIVLRASPEITAEVGLCFLLAELNNDPVINKTRDTIQKAINLDAGLIPTSRGNPQLTPAERRNVLAIMLLDWQGVHATPTPKATPQLFRKLPYGLLAKNGG